MNQQKKHIDNNQSAFLAQLKSLSKVSKARYFFEVAKCWSLIIFSCVAFPIICTTLWQTENIVLRLASIGGVYLVFASILTAQAHAFGILVHEATHFKVFANRELSDLFFNFTVAFPISLSIKGYRYEHQLHHIHTNTEKDPYWASMQKDKDWHWPKSRSETFGIFIKDFFGINGDKWAKITRPWSPFFQLFKTSNHGYQITWKERIQLITFIIIIGMTVAKFNFGFYFFFLWVLPVFAYLSPFVRMRSISEHLNINTESNKYGTRHVDCSWIEKQLIAPFGINYHLAHHLYPSVPYYNLPKLHNLLSESDSVYIEQSKLYKSYLFGKNSVLAEMVIKQKQH